MVFFFKLAPISVIIPVYNRKSYILKTLYALAHNKYDFSKLEVIIADDGSSDGLQREIVNHTFPYTLKYVHQKDKGYRLAKIRNEALKVASHSYIIFLDCDMVPSRDFLRAHLNVLLKHPTAVSLGHREFVSFESITIPFIQDNLRAIDSLPRVAHRKTGSDEDWRVEFYKNTHNLQHCSEPYWACVGGNFGAATALIINAGLFDEDFTEWGREDTELGYRLHKLGAKFMPNRSAVAYHLDHPVSMKKINASIERMHILFERKIKKWQEKLKRVNNPYFSNIPTKLKEERGIVFYSARG